MIPKRLIILACAVGLSLGSAAFALEDNDDGPIGEPCASQECKDNDAGYKYAEEHKIKEAHECAAGHSEAFLSGCEDWLDEQEDGDIASDDEDVDHTHLPSHDADANDLEQD